MIDATNVQPEARKPLVALARKYHCMPVAIILNLPEKLCTARIRSRPDRDFGGHVIRNQLSQLRRSLRELKREGFRHVYVLDSAEEVGAVTIDRQPLWNNREFEKGPFDIIGDVYGCFDELAELLEKLEYRMGGVDGLSFGRGYTVAPPPGRKVIFLGDLVDRGPKSPEILRLAMSMCAEGTAHCVPGNYDAKLVRWLDGKNVQLRHGLAETALQLGEETTEFKATVREFLDGLVSHYVFDGGTLVVAHAGMKEEYQGRGPAG